MKRIVLFILLVPLALIAFRIDNLHKHHNKQVPDSTHTKEDEKLFYELLDSGLLTPASFTQNEKDEGSQKLTLTPPDYIYTLRELRDAAREGIAKKELAQREQLIKKLYRKEVGKAVRRSVQLWNDSHHFAAIRDNRANSTNESNNSWVAYSHHHPTIRMREGNAVPEFGVFVTDGVMKPGFNDWLQSYSDDDEIAFQTEVTLEEKTIITAQVIGSLVSAHPTPSNIDYRPITGQSFQTLSASANPAGAALNFALPPGRHHLEIVLNPVEFYQNHVPGLNIAWNSDKQMPGSPKWVARKPTAQSGSVPIEMFTSDQVKIFNFEGHATEDAWNRGLTALIGKDRKTRNKLAWILSSLDKKSSITLTIDSHIQKIAQHHLEKQLEDLWGQDDLAGSRKGAVVMMDADTGELLATASYPRLQENINSWDLRAFDTFYAIQNWQSFKPWQGIDSHNAPGSTFKPVVAMAAIQPFLEGNTDKRKVDSFLTGYSQSKFYKTGLTLDCSAYNPFKKTCYNSRSIPGSQLVVSNFGRKPILSSFKAGDQKLGLKQAIRDSLNVWFVRLAWLIDGEEATRYDAAMTKLKSGQAKPKRPDLNLGKFAKQLGFNGQSLDLLKNVNDSNLRRNFPHKQAEGDVAFATTGRISLLEREQRGLQRILTRNSFGQGVVASPLQMTRVAALIATGKLPSPYLIKSLNSEVLDAPSGQEWSLDYKTMGLLRAGMKEVTESGTAAQAFRNHPKRYSVYGKTGTASAKRKSKFWTTWFMGWQEPEKSNGRRIAFACFVTHAKGKKQTGGSVAAPIIANILKNLNSTTGNPL